MRDNLPLSYRMYPMDVKKYSVSIDVDTIKNNDSLIKIHSSNTKNVKSTHDNCSYITQTN